MEGVPQHSGAQQTHVEAEPGEEESVGRVLKAVVEAAKHPAPSDSKQTGPRLFETIDKYLEEEERSGHWRPQTALDIRGDFNQFKSILGDIWVFELSHDVFNTLRETLPKLPANIKKLPQTRGKPIAEILALGLPPQSARTVQKKWDRLVAFCDRLQGLGLISHNFARGKKPRARSAWHEKMQAPLSLSRHIGHYHRDAAQVADRHIDFTPGREGPVLLREISLVLRQDSRCERGFRDRERLRRVLRHGKAQQVSRGDIQGSCRGTDSIERQVRLARFDHR